MSRAETLTAKNASQQAFFPLMRELVRTYQAFASLDAAGYHDTELTVSQADVIFTLGNTPGMTFKEIGEQTLITKGTLTGVIDRLEEKGLVSRKADIDDRRCMRVILTARGEKVFQKEFPRQVGFLKSHFDRLSKKEMQQTILVLQKLRTALS